MGHEQSERAGSKGVQSRQGLIMAMYGKFFSLSSCGLTWLKIAVKYNIKSAVKCQLNS